jgi:hypothetical protein
MKIVGKLFTVPFADTNPSRLTHYSASPTFKSGNSIHEVLQALLLSEGFHLQKDIVTNRTADNIASFNKK